MGDIRLDVVGSVATVSIDHPERRNAMTVAMWEQVPPLCERIAADDTIRVVVLRGAGEVAFAAGADISEFESVRKGADGARSYDAIENAGLTALASIPQPVVAAIHGFCFGGGVAMALTADLRYAADDALMAIPAGRLGLAYPIGGLKKLVDLVGVSAAREIFFRAKRFRAAEALSVGLVNEVHPKADLDAYIDTVTTDIASNAPLTLRQVKLATGQLLLDAADRDLEAIEAAADLCFDSADYEEGVAAFLDKRDPNFEGR